MVDVDVCVSSHLKEVLTWAADKWLRAISTIMLFKKQLSLSTLVLSLSTLVLNSRDRYEKKWQPNFTRLKTRLRISNI